MAIERISRARVEEQVALSDHGIACVHRVIQDDPASFVLK